MAILLYVAILHYILLYVAILHYITLSRCENVLCRSSALLCFQTEVTSGVLEFSCLHIFLFVFVLECGFVITIVFLPKEVFYVGICHPTILFILLNKQVYYAFLCLMWFSCFFLSLFLKKVYLNLCHLFLSFFLCFFFSPRFIRGVSHRIWRVKW